MKKNSGIGGGNKSMYVNHRAHKSLFKMDKDEVKSDAIMI